MWYYSLEKYAVCRHQSARLWTRVVEIVKQLPPMWPPWGSHCTIIRYSWRCFLYSELRWTEMQLVRGMVCAWIIDAWEGDYLCEVCHVDEGLTCILLSVNLGDDGHFSPWCMEWQQDHNWRLADTSVLSHAVFLCFNVSFVYAMLSGSMRSLVTVNACLVVDGHGTAWSFVAPKIHTWGSS